MPRRGFEPRQNLWRRFVRPIRYAPLLHRYLESLFQSLRQRLRQSAYLAALRATPPGLANAARYPCHSPPNQPSCYEPPAADPSARTSFYARSIDSSRPRAYIARPSSPARVAELVDALVSGTSE